MSNIKSSCALRWQIFVDEVSERASGSVVASSGSASGSFTQVRPLPATAAALAEPIPCAQNLYSHPHLHPRPLHLHRHCGGVATVMLAVAVGGAQLYEEPVSNDRRRRFDDEETRMEGGAAVGVGRAAEDRRRCRLPAPCYLLPSRAGSIRPAAE